MTADQRIGLDRIRQIPDGIRTLDSVVEKLRKSAKPAEPKRGYHPVVTLEQLELRRLSPSELRERKGVVRYLGQPR